MLSITDGPLNKFLPTPALCRCLPIRGEETALLTVVSKDMTAGKNTIHSTEGKAGREEERTKERGEGCGCIFTCCWFTVVQHCSSPIGL